MLSRLIFDFLPAVPSCWGFHQPPRRRSPQRQAAIYHQQVWCLCHDQNGDAKYGLLQPAQSVDCLERRSIQPVPDGGQMFGLIRCDAINDETGLAFGLRGSHNKSLSRALAGGLLPLTRQPNALSGCRHQAGIEGRPRARAGGAGPGSRISDTRYTSKRKPNLSERSEVRFSG